MEAPTVSLSRAAQGVFQAEQYSHVSRTMRNGRIVRVVSRSSSVPQARSPSNNGKSCAPNVEADKTESHLPTKLDKIVPTPTIQRRPTIESEPDAEPDARADHQAVEKQSDNSPRLDAEESQHQAELKLLTAQLMEARAQTDQLRVNQAKSEERRREAEEKSTKLSVKCRLHEETISKIKHAKAKENAKLAAEKAHLERKLNRLQRGPSIASAKSCFDHDRLATHMADTECGPLKHCSPEDRVALKKKLLLKWHPDKQPSAVHSAFATRVMQEMQNCAEWAD